MVLSSNHQIIIDKLYALYEGRGFIREDEVLALMAVNDVSLQDTERLTGILLGLGVIFGDDGFSDDDADIDKSQTDYEMIFNEVVSISPGQALFINYIRNIRPPQWREWQTLMPQAKTGNPYAFNRLFEMYLRVVVKFALSAHKNYKFELDDLLQEGAMGLMRAIRKYDSNKHGSFVSYLPLWVKQYMDRAVVGKCYPIRIPVHMYETMVKFQTTANKLEMSIGHPPSIAEIAFELGITLDEAEQIQSYFYELEPFDNFLIVHSDGFIEYNLLDTDITNPFNDVDNRLLHDVIISLLNTLKNREGTVLRLRFGIDDEYDRTLEEVGKHFNVTRERIRQIEATSLRRLRHPSRSKKLRDFLSEL